jgi:dTDP-4-dehydrorhamnose reductase
MIIILGGTGLLGKELSKNKNTLAVGSEYDLYDFRTLEQFLDKKKPKIIINCAAIKSEKVDEFPINAINLNIIGNANISKYCILNKIRLVFISTDYVYPGDVGNYIETDNLNPQNNYAWTKLAGESSTKLVPKHLIVRTSFGNNIFPYEYAYDNLYTSKDYVDVIAPMIYKVSVSDLIGTVNVGTNRKTILEYANKRNNVESKSLPVSRDFSLNIQKMMNLYA